MAPHGKFDQNDVVLPVEFSHLVCRRGLFRSQVSDPHVLERLRHLARLCQTIARERSTANKHHELLGASLLARCRHLREGTRAGHFGPVCRYDAFPLVGLQRECPQLVGRRGANSGAVSASHALERRDTTKDILVHSRGHASRICERAWSEGRCYGRRGARRVPAVHTGPLHGLEVEAPGIGKHCGAFRESEGDVKLIGWLIKHRNVPRAALWTDPRRQNLLPAVRGVENVQPADRAAGLGRAAEDDGPRVVQCGDSHMRDDRDRIGGGVLTPNQREKVKCPRVLQH